MGRTPIIDPIKHPAACRAVREAVRFGSRKSNPIPGAPLVRWSAMCRQYGFKSHRSLFMIADRYEATYGLGREDREDPAIVQAREDAADKA